MVVSVRQPCDFLSGAGLLINIISAHAIRFKVRATGSRRLIGLVVLTLGFIVTGMMIRGMFAQDLVATDGSGHVDAVPAVGDEGVGPGFDEAVPIRSTRDGDSVLIGGFCGTKFYRERNNAVSKFIN